MRVLLVLSFALFLVCFSQPASACLSESMEYSLFLEPVPAVIANRADTIAEVVILESSQQGTGRIKAVSDFLLAKDEKAKITDVVKARITRVIKGNVNVGDMVFLQYAASSCGPNVTVYDPKALQKRMAIEKKMKVKAAALGEPVVVDGFFSRSTSSGTIAAMLSDERGLPGGSVLLYPFAIRKSAEGKTRFSAGDINDPYAP